MNDPLLLPSPDVMVVSLTEMSVLVLLPRSSQLEAFFLKAVQIKFPKFKGKHLFGLFFNKK